MCPYVSWFGNVWDNLGFRFSRFGVCCFAAGFVAPGFGSELATLYARGSGSWHILTVCQALSCNVFNRPMLYQTRNHPVNHGAVFSSILRDQLEIWHFGVQVPQFCQSLVSDSHSWQKMLSNQGDFGDFPHCSGSTILAYHHIPAMFEFICFSISYGAVIVIIVQRLLGLQNQMKWQKI